MLCPSATFIREISNNQISNRNIKFQWQCVLRSTDAEVTVSSNLAENKSNSKTFCTETNHTKSLRSSRVLHFEFLAKYLASNVDLLMISEKKIDNRNSVYVREDIPVELLSVEPFPAEFLFVEINLREKKWLVCWTYNPHKDNMSNHLKLIRNFF